MDSFFFLFFLGGAWIIFATVQDLKTREVANWLTFSLISFGIAFYAFTSIFEQTLAPLIYSVAGGILFTVFIAALRDGLLVSAASNVDSDSIGLVQNLGHLLFTKYTPV